MRSLTKFITLLVQAEFLDQQLDLRMQANFHMMRQTNEVEEYSTDTAKIIANIMHDYSFAAVDKTSKHYAFLQSHNLKQRLKKFGQKGSDAASEEMKQLRDRKVFSPVHFSVFTPMEQKRAMTSLIFLVEKRYGRVKA